MASDHEISILVLRFPITANKLDKYVRSCCRGGARSRKKYIIHGAPATHEWQTGTPRRIALHNRSLAAGNRNMIVL